MEDIISKINQAYEKGISNPRFQEALDEVIRNSETVKENKLEKTDKSFNKEDREDR